MTEPKKDLLGRNTEPQETAPAVRQPTPPAIPQEDLGLAGQFDESDFVIPAWFLVQPTSQDFPDAEPGQFATRDGRKADSLKVVVLRIAATRALWPKEMGEGRRPLCASNDRVQGRPFGDFEPYDSWGKAEHQDEIRCQDCGHYNDNPWDDESGKDGCYKGYAILMALVDDDDEPAVIRIKGTSMSPVKQKLLSHFQLRPGRVPMPVWAKVFELHSEKGENVKGKFFIVTPKLVGATENPDHYRDLARHLAGVSVEAVEEDLPFEEEGQEEEPFE